MNNSMHDLQIYNDNGNHICFTVDVGVNENFKSHVGTNLQNWWYIHVERNLNIKSSKYETFWDNLDFFVNATKKEIEVECKQELIDKELYYAEIFADIKKEINKLIKAVYLTKSK